MSKLSTDKIRYLAALGLAGDQVHIGYYVAAMENPYETVRDSFRREYAADVLNKLLDIAAEDQLVYDHIVSNLTKGNPNRERGRPWISDRAMEAIEDKAVESGIPVPILLELYNRGYNQPPKIHLTKENQAFNCINSYIAKGKAWRDNPDLRLDGTDSLRQIYSNDTPGEPNSLNTKKSTIDTIKRIVKK